MKTHDELQNEARRMEALGRRYAADDGQDGVDGVAPKPRVLLAFPESRLRVDPPLLAEDEEAFATVKRWVEVGRNEGRLEYRLFEAPSENTDRSDRDIEPLFVMGSDAAFDVLQEGYKLIEEERIGEALAPFIERVENEEFIREIEPTHIEEIGKIVGAEDLTSADWVRANTDIVAFLEGQLEPSEFIAAAVERHGRRETHYERFIERPGDRMVIDHP